MLVCGVSYVLSWPILYDGPQGIDYLWHWHVASWVASAFPGLPYWNRWDLSGVPYRNLYPLLPHWVAVAISRASGLDLFGGMQVVEFATTPLLALGLYAFCDWRLKRPLVGLVACLLFLINPLSWVENVDYLWFASQLGLVFFMPSVIALDWFFSLWRSKDRTSRWRFAAGLFMGLAALTGAVSPAALTAPLLVLLAYVLACERASRWRWLIGPVPALALGALTLQLFWIGPFFGFLSFVGQRAPAIVFSSALVTTFDVRKLLEIVPISAVLDTDRYSISPAVWLPALAGLMYALRDARARVAAALSVVALLLLTVKWLYVPVGIVPAAGTFVEALYRPAAIHLRFFVPLLGAIGLVALPRDAVTWAGTRMRWPAGGLAAAGWGAVAVATVLLFIDVTTFAGRAVDWPHTLAYGPGFEGTYRTHGPDIRDLWLRHPDGCRFSTPPFPACQSSALGDVFSVSELVAACDAGNRSPRSTVPICVALGPDLTKADWHAADDGLIAATQSWCRGRSDPVCTAQYDPLWRQLVDPSLWRPPFVGCSLTFCQTEAGARQSWASVFNSPPQRLEAQGEVQPLAAAARELTGGAAAGTIAVGGGGAEPSRELYQFVENWLLKRPGVAVKSELAAITGIDAVALGPTQVGESADYAAMGWLQTSAQPVAFQDPSPSGLAEEWAGGNAVLVVGASQTSAADVYNSVFERSASGGLVPFARGWLVRGATPFVDDYSAADLARYQTIVLVGYRYHSHDAAWGLLSQWVQRGGRLFVETGWQYVDPDWSGGTTPSMLPVSTASWGRLDPAAPVVVGAGTSARTDPGFGEFRYQGGGWGASSAPVSALRPGAEPVVTVGGRVVVARTSYGSGRVLWSGANLLAHASQSASTSEDGLIRDQFGWLLPNGGPGSSNASPAAAVSLPQTWSGNEAVSIPLTASAGPALVLFKESLFPGWSVQLVRGDGSQQRMDILDSEYDYILVPLESVPAGSRLEFVYRPPLSEVAWWASSVVGLTLIAMWLLRPRAFMLTRGAGWELIRRRIPVRWADADF